MLKLKGLNYKKLAIYCIITAKRGHDIHRGKEHRNIKLYTQPSTHSLERQLTISIIKTIYSAAKGPSSFFMWRQMNQS